MTQFQNIVVNLFIHAYYFCLTHILSIDSSSIYIEAKKGSIIEINTILDFEFLHYIWNIHQLTQSNGKCPTL